MEAHAVPQNVTAFEFHLIGNMTMKQFGYLAASLVVGFIIFVLFGTTIPMIAWPIIAVTVSIGSAYAFLPIMERPLDYWTAAFIKAVTRPTLRKYRSFRFPKEDDNFRNRLSIYLQYLQKSELTEESFTSLPPSQTSFISTKDKNTSVTTLPVTPLPSSSTQTNQIISFAPNPSPSSAALQPIPAQPIPVSPLPIPSQTPKRDDIQKPQLPTPKPLTPQVSKPLPINPMPVQAVNPSTPGSPVSQPAQTPPQSKPALQSQSTSSSLPSTPIPNSAQPAASHLNSTPPPNTTPDQISQFLEKLSQLKKQTEVLQPTIKIETPKNLQTITGNITINKDTPVQKHVPTPSPSSLEQNMPKPSLPTPQPPKATIPASAVPNIIINNPTIIQTTEKGAEIETQKILKLLEEQQVPEQSKQEPAQKEKSGPIIIMPEDFTQTDRNLTTDKINQSVGLAKEVQQIQDEIHQTEKQINWIRSANKTSDEFQSALVKLQKLHEEERQATKKLALIGKTPSPVTAPPTKPSIIPTLTLTSTANVINGIVIDTTGRYIEGAIIVAHDSQGMPVRALKTNKLGQFIAATPLRDGKYTINVEKEDLQFAPAEIELNGAIMNPVVISAKKGGASPL